MKSHDSHRNNWSLLLLLTWTFQFRHYQKGLRLDPEHGELKKAYFGLKNLLKKTKSVSSINIFFHIVSLSPLSCCNIMWCNLRLVLNLICFIQAEDNVNKGKLRLAVEDFKGALSLDPNHLAHNVHLHLGLCKVLVQLGRGKDALTSCTEALTIDEDLIDALVQVCFVSSCFRVY